MARELLLVFILIVAAGPLALLVIRVAPRVRLRLGRRPEWRFMVADVD